MFETRLFDELWVVDTGILLFYAVYAPHLELFCSLIFVCSGSAILRGVRRCIRRFYTI
jgi:hypothetical protein